MKTKFFYAMLVMVAALLCSCNPSFTEPRNTITVVKLKKSEYKNYVLASHFKDVDHFESLRGNNCEEPIGKAGNSPYWELADGWLLVDWKWHGFPYAISTALTEQTWDNFEWRNTNGNHQTWPLTEPHTKENPIKETVYIAVANLEKYSNTHYGDEMAQLIYYNFHQELLCDKSEKMDSIWTILQSELSAAIKNGDLKIINHKKYDPDSRDYYLY